MSHRLSDSQLRFWKGQQLQPDVPLYNVAWRFDLKFKVQPDLFRRAFRETIDENEILRVVFRTDGETPYQTVLPYQDDVLQVIQLEPSDDAQNALDQHLDHWVRTPFDLERGSLRSQLIELSGDHWVWALCQHHITCDAHSDTVLFDQVSRRYAALERNGSDPLEPSPRFFESPPVQAAETETPTVTAPLPVSPPYGSAGSRPPSSTRIAVPVPAEVNGALDVALARPEFRLLTPDLSRLALYLTAYLAYLHRITGDEQLTIGLPFHNRLSARDKQTLGPFVEVLPFTIPVSAQDSLLDLHTKVKAGLGDFLRQAKPGAVARIDNSGISAVCNYIQADFGAFAGRPVAVTWLHSGAHDVTHALRLHILDFAKTGRPELYLDVHDTVLDAVPADCLRHHFLTVLNTTLRAPDTPVAAMDLGAQGSDRSLTYGPTEPPEIPQTVLTSFAARVAASPDALAISCGKTRITYKELDQRSDQIASGITAQSIPGASPIAIHMPRSAEVVMIILGILKAGCSFVPIAANMPFERAQDIVSGSGAAAVFLTPEDDREFGCQKLDITLVEAGHAPRTRLPEGHATAYVLFTSGSTGIPKGVEVSHSGLSRYVHWAAQTFGDNQPARYALFSSLSFDLTVTSVFAPLVSGGSIRVYPERSDPDLAVLDVFAEDAVDVVKLTPSHLALTCKQKRAVDRIQTLILGGENLTSQLCRQARETLSPSLRLINEYGPTEAVVGAMHHLFDSRIDTSPSVQIGVPAAGVSISIRDAGLTLCPLGVAGEIIIGGRLAKGYLAAPETTAEKFLDDPQNLQGRIYRTGDIGRMNRDGSIEYLGRADQQVKIGGVRFEVAEMDRVLRQIPGVDAVHVAYGPSGAKVEQRQHCKKCGLTDAVPGVTFSQTDQCDICLEFYGYKDRAQAYFRDEPALQRRIDHAARTSTGSYDAVMMLSGGKDSTYAAYRLSDYTSRVLAVTLDNGFISEQAKANIQRVVADLGWDHRYLRTDKMNQIFVDSLKSHSNVCQGCFKALYTLAFRTALAEGAAMVVTGLSRGQFFETRLTPDLFRNAAPTCAQLDEMVTKARKAYHAEDDALSRLLQTDDLKDGRFLNQIEVLDIYRYIDVPVSEIYDYLDRRTSWQRPSDTGRSTNCLINDAGIHVHKAREGYHNYALPYSWDVRMGHKTPEQAMEELNDSIDVSRVADMLERIGFDEPVQQNKLSVYVAGRNLSEQEIWQRLEAHFPRGLLPDEVALLEDMPLNANGKVDTSSLPKGRGRGPGKTNRVGPETDVERTLSTCVAAVIGTSEFGVTDDFFDLGIDSLAAIEIAMKANEVGLPLPATALFEHRTIRSLAVYANGLASAGIENHSDDALIQLDDDDLSGISEALG